MPDEFVGFSVKMELATLNRLQAAAREVDLSLRQYCVNAIKQRLQQGEADGVSRTGFFPAFERDWNSIEDSLYDHFK